METSPTKCPLVFADVNQDDLFTLFKRIFIRTRLGTHVRKITREKAKHIQPVCLCLEWCSRQSACGCSVSLAGFWKRGCSLPHVHTHIHTHTEFLKEVVLCLMYIHTYTVFERGCSLPHVHTHTYTKTHVHTHTHTYFLFLYFSFNFTFLNINREAGVGNQRINKSVSLS